LDFYQSLYPDAKLNRWFPTFGLSANYSAMISDGWSAVGLLEAASEAPETEYLFIAVQKPMAKPNWSGNPTLDQPIRTTLRGSISYDYFSMELFGTRVWNYVNLNKASVGIKLYSTYENVDAYLLGFNFRLNWNFIELNAGYTYAQNTTNNSPFSEILPLHISTKLSSPTIFNTVVFVKHTYNNAQLRVDEVLNETTTPTWNKFDIGAIYNASSFLISIEVENLTNALYYQHLSYLRSPFASGNKVFEPGTTVRLTFRLNQLL
jgi:iron complex outermembrane receptor protein